MSNVSKSRSWTFPAWPSAAVGAAPGPFAGFLRPAGGAAAARREGDSGADGGEAVTGEELCAAASEVQRSTLEGW